MTYFLIASIFAITIFTGISLEPLIPSFFDARQTKEWISLLCASGFVIYALYHGRLQIKNKALLAFIGYMLISIMNAPPFIIQYGAVNIANSWMYQPALKWFVYILFFGAMSGIDIDMDRLFKWLYWLALGTAAFCLLQALGMDQFYFVGSTLPQKNTTNAHITGTLGNPTICAAFLAMLLPIALHLRKWAGAAFIAGIVLFIRSDMATTALIGGTFSYYVFKGVINRWLAVGLLCAVIVAGVALYPQISARSSGRTGVWAQVARDIVKSPVDGRSYALTGMGLGSFSSFYVNTHKSLFKEAHCEPLQAVYEIGILGLGLLIWAIWLIVKNGGNPVILAGLVAVFINSLGAFPFQIEPLAFLTVLFFAIAKL